jgi:ribosomal protein L16/L10AE
MLLRPRKFLYKTIQKPRAYITPKKVVTTFGPISVFTKRPLMLTSHKMFRIKLFLKKATRKTDKTGRYFWINLFPYLPLSKKVLGSRMGKGKGKAHS